MLSLVVLMLALRPNGSFMGRDDRTPTRPIRQPLGRNANIRTTNDSINALRKPTITTSNNVNTRLNYTTS